LSPQQVLAITEAGEAIETGIVGADGLVGGGVTLNGHLFGQAIVQIEGSALTIQKDQFVEAYNTHKTLRNLVNRFQAILLVQAQQCVVCHALHSVNSRLCRWLLWSRDMIGGNISSPHAGIFCLICWGVRRSTVSVEANMLQAASSMPGARSRSSTGRRSRNALANAIR
jgi:hypothetical protein